MRINRYVALASGVSRRQADKLIAAGRVKIEGQLAQPGQIVNSGESITLDNKNITLSDIKTILFNKPVGYIVSRKGQGAKTIYSLLPKTYSNLQPVGRLDKDSSGLLILTNDGQLAQRLTHPSAQKLKTYTLELDKPLSPEDQKLLNAGVELDDGLSKLEVKALNKDRRFVEVSMHEGRNRQIRRSFTAVGYTVVSLSRIKLDKYRLEGLKPGDYQEIDT